MKVGQWTESALKVMNERYLARNSRGVQETPEEMCWRVASAIAAAEQRWGKSAEEIQATGEAFYDMMVDCLFLPNSPTLMNAGTNNGLGYSACFVLARLISTCVSSASSRAVTSFRSITNWSAS